ncbi:MAG: IMPACT family protein [Leucothrix sp.]
MLVLRQPYLTLSAPCEFEIEPIKHSRFIANAFPVSNEAAVPELINTVKTHAPDAGHHCWAYILKQPERLKFSDDGEPGGSAGRPMLNQLQGRELFDCLVIVTRYFGGTKLGVGGLMRAYGGAVAQCLDRADFKTVTPTLPLWIRYQYTDTSYVEAALLGMKLVADETRYGEHIDARIQVPDSDMIDVYNALSTQVGGRLLLTLPDAIASTLGQ